MNRSDFTHMWLLSRDFYLEIHQKHLSIATVFEQVLRKILKLGGIRFVLRQVLDVWIAHSKHSR